MAALHLTEGNYDKDFPTAVDEFPTVEDLQHYIDAWELNSLFSSIKVVQQYLITHKDAIESTVLDSFSGADGVKEIPVPAGRYPSGKTCTANDADLVAANIKKDTIIFGVTGSLDVTAKDSFSGAEGLKVIPIPAGTYPAEKTCTAVDADLIAANIKKDVIIFGVTGALEGAAPGREKIFYPRFSANDGFLARGLGLYPLAIYTEFGYGGRDEEPFWLFPDADIIAGSTITEAILEMTAQRTKTDTDIYVKIHFNAIDDAVPPTTEILFDALDLDAGIEWGPFVSYSVNVSYSTPCLKDLLQGIIDRPGWTSGNALQIIIKNNGTVGDNRKYLHTVDSVFGAYQSCLKVKWTEPAA